MQDKRFSKLEQEIFDNVNAYISKKDYSLVDISLAVIDKQSTLSIFVYASDKMTLNDIAKLSEEIEPIIDGIESLTESYLLEVSSPGINRTFKHLYEFNIFKGQQIKVITEDGRKIIGECGGLTDENVIINNGELISKEKIEKQQYIININDISKAKLFS